MLIFFHCQWFHLSEERFAEELHFMLPIMVSWSGAPTPIISWNVLHQCGCCPPPFVIICSSSASQYPTRRLTSNIEYSKLWVASVVKGVGWGVNPPTLFNNSAPGSLPPSKPPLPAPGPRPAAHYMGSQAASTGKPQLLQGSTTPTNQPKYQPSFFQICHCFQMSKSPP